MLSIWKFSIWRNRWKRQERQSHDHRLIQVGRDLGRSLVLPPAQNRSSSEFRPGSSVLFPVGSWKLQEQKQYNFSGQPAPLSNCCPYIPFLLTSSFFPFVAVASHPPTTHHCEDCGSCWPIFSACLGPSGRQPCPSAYWLIPPVWCHLQALWRCIWSLPPRHW